MFTLKLVLATVFVVASARHMPWDEQRYDQEYFLGFDEGGRPVFDQGDLLPEPEESYHPGNLARTRRASNSVTLNSDGSQGYHFGFDEEGRPVFDQGDLLPEPEESYHPGNLAKTRSASSSVTFNSDGSQGYHLGFDEEGRPVFDQGDLLPEPEESYHPGNLARTRRASSSVTLNSDGSVGLVGKVPIAGNEKNRLSALGTMDFNNNLDIGAKGLGLQLENNGGHSLMLMKQNVPGREDSWTGAGKLNVFHNDNHNVDVRGSLTRHMPAVPNVPNFNTVGGGVDYMYKDKVGASLGMASTPFLDRKDYSAMGNLNLYRNPTTSLDFSGGFRKMDTPYFKTSWEPNYGFTLSKYF